MQNIKIEQPMTFESQGSQIVGIHHKVNSRKIVIMCHGFTGNKSEDKRLYVEAARDFASRGFNALRFDFYGSGDSEGDFQDTLISHDIKNLEDAIAWAQQSAYERIAVLGLSLGAATAILAIPGQPVDALITWSAVPDMRLLYEHHAEEFISNDKDIIEYNGFLLKREFFQQAIEYDIQDSLAHITVPKFIVQGTADEQLFVDGFFSFRNVVTPPADFMHVPDAGHTFANPVHRRRVIRQTTLWLQRHL